MSNLLLSDEAIKEIWKEAYLDDYTVEYARKVVELALKRMNKQYTKLVKVYFVDHARVENVAEHYGCSYSDSKETYNRILEYVTMTKFYLDNKESVDRFISDIIERVSNSENESNSLNERQALVLLGSLDTLDINIGTERTIRRNGINFVYELFSLKNYEVNGLYRLGSKKYEEVLKAKDKLLNKLGISDERLRGCCILIKEVFSDMFGEDISCYDFNYYRLRECLDPKVFSKYGKVVLNEV